MANHRSGPCRGTRSGTRRGTLEWRKDVVILRRIAWQEDLRAEGWVGQALLDRINARCTAEGIDPISREALYDDHHRSRDLMEDEAKDAKHRHLASIEHIKREAMSAFHDTGSQSLNRSAYLNVALRAEETSAKLDGTLSPQSIKAEGKLGDVPLEFTLTFPNADDAVGDA